MIIGGFAATVHGSTVVTEDLDLCISFDRENIERLLAALSGIHPRHRLIKEARPLVESVEELSSFRNLYLETDLGYLDTLSEVKSIGGYEDVFANSVEVKLFGISCRILDIEALIKVKKDMGRTKDKESVIQLKAIREKMTQS